MCSRVDINGAVNWTSYSVLLLLLGVWFTQVVPGSRAEGHKFGLPDAILETALAKSVVKSAEEFVLQIKIMTNGKDDGQSKAKKKKTEKEQGSEGKLGNGKGIDSEAAEGSLNGGN